MTAIMLSGLTFFSTALGGLFALHRRNHLYLVMGFSAGILVAAALLDLLPDAFEVIKQSGQSSVGSVLLGATLGFLTYYSLDRLVHRGAAGHEGRHEKEAFGSLLLLGSPSIASSTASRLAARSKRAQPSAGSSPSP
jgi:zinc transporter ZupT